MKSIRRLQGGAVKTSMKNGSGRGRLAIGVLSGVLGVATSHSAAAQEAAQEDKLEEVVVTGIRGSLQNALDLKSSSQGIVDAISAEDVGRFPEQNLAESLQRITGVQITRSQGEGQNITIRGLPSDFTVVQFNGRSLPSVNKTSNYTSGSGERSFDFTMIPADFISELVVFKTAVADIEEGGISGTVQIKTIRPLDLGRRVLSGSVTGVYENNSEETTPKVAALYSDVFADGTFGISLGAHYDTRSLRTDSFVGYGAEVGVESGRNPPLDYNLDGDFADRIRFHHENRYFEQDTEKERLTLLATLQWKPTDSTDIWFETLYSEFNTDSHNYLNTHRFTSVKFPGVILDSHVVADPTGTTQGFADYVDFAGVDIRSNESAPTTDDSLLSAALGLRKEFGEWTAEVEASLSEADGTDDSLGLSAIARGHVSYDFRGISLTDIPPLAYGDDYDPFDPENFRVLSFGGALDEKREDSNRDIRLDIDRNLEWNLGSNLTVSSFEIGTKFSSREKFAGYRRLDVNGVALAGFLGKTYDYTAPEGGFTLPEYMVRRTTSNFLDGYEGTAVWPTEWLNMSTPLFIQSIDLNSLIAAGNIIEGGSSEYTVKEDVSAAYVKLNYEGFDGRLSGNIGVRYVKTDQESNGYFPDPTTLIFDGGGTTYAESSNSSVNRSYDEVLPSFNLQYKISDEVALRFGAARVMSRPTMQVLSPSQAYNVNTRSITSNNPNVAPFIANQIDVSLEWYYGDTGFLSFAPFMKDIKSFIVSATNPEQVTYYNRATEETVTDTFTRFQPDNGKGSKMFGYEMNWIQPLDFIVQGLGFQGNFTFVDADDVQTSEGGPLLPLTGLSRTSYNLIGYYENDKFGTRLAYNFRDSFVVNATSFFGDGQITKAYSQLDLSANYNFNENVSIYLDGLNLTEEVIFLVNSFGLNRGVEDNGTRSTLGVHVNFN